MDTKLKVFLTIVILLVLVAAFYFISQTITRVTGKSIFGWVVKENSKPTNTINIDDFVKCLSDERAKMYGAYWCGHCQNQKALFGNSAEFMNKVYVECDSGGENPKPELCQEKKIEGYPTWEINGEFYSGEQSLNRLAELSGCKLK